MIGGDEAYRGEFPWMVNVSKGGRLWNGAVINEEYVLTVAGPLHEGVSASQLTLVAGDHDITAPEGTEQKRAVERIVVHPSFDPSTHVHDIAILKVTEPFVLNSRVQSATLPLDPFDPTTYMDAVGWGPMTEGESVSPQLQKVSLPYVDHKTAHAAYSGGIEKKSMVAAGFLGRGGKGAATGDEGSNLIADTGSTRFLAGLFSFARGTASPDYPSIFTRVSHHTEWINSVVAG
ncbi:MULTISPECIES: serine protease [unclassified Streptomyces]|uniref:serine protease n=1 Tax=unclassified Streptomyces TaxID=2593676 RepID=UPI0033B5DFC3